MSILLVLVYEYKTTIDIAPGVLHVYVRTATASPSRVAAGALTVMHDTLQSRVAARTAAWSGHERRSQ
jgi:hypothetical protein